MNKYDFIDTVITIDESKIKDFDTIYDICKDIADRKLNSDVNMLLAEELSELIQPIIKLERWKTGDEFLRCEYKDIINNIYEELSDVIIMLFQFIHKNDVLIDKLTDEISKKLIRVYETKYGGK